MLQLYLYFLSLLWFDFKMLIFLKFNKNQRFENSSNKFEIRVWVWVRTVREKNVV